MSLMKRPAPGVTTRLAAESDGPALRDLERRSAIETDGVSVYYDRGDDYFAQQRLMQQHQTSVAEYQGRIVGVLSDAIRPVRVAGIGYRATYRFHLRVDPGARGLGIWPALNAANSRFLFAERPLPVPSSFVAVDNAQLDAVAGPDQRSSRWATPVECMVLPCRELAGVRHGRAARPEDATRIGRAARVVPRSRGARSRVRTRMGRTATRPFATRLLLAARNALGAGCPRRMGFGIAHRPGGRIRNGHDAHGDRSGLGIRTGRRRGDGGPVAICLLDPRCCRGR